MKIRKEMESITESITIPAVKFEKEKMMKKRLHVKNTWYDWLNNYVPQPVKNSRWYYRKIMCIF